MESRVCVCCGDAKPVSGIWYAMADGPGSFMCGACFYEETGSRVPTARA